jgi:hypothetical protein
VESSQVNGKGMELEIEGMTIEEVNKKNTLEQE